MAKGEHEECSPKKWKMRNSGGTPGAFYGLGFVGALIYFLQHATTLWTGILAILKAIVWPALLIYKVLELLKF